MCQIIDLTNGERTIARVNAEDGEVLECGAEGNCMFDAFLVGANLTGNPELVIAVSWSGQLARNSRLACVVQHLSFAGAWRLRTRRAQSCCGGDEGRLGKLRAIR